MRQEGWNPLLVIYWKKKQKIQIVLRNKKGNKENKGNYKRLSIHIYIKSMTELFAICIARANSFLNRRLLVCIEGFICRKMKSMRDIQMLQQPRMIISMKKGTWSCCRNEATTSVWSWKGGTTNPKDAQNWVAKGQVKNRWSRVSLELWWQSTQSCDYFSKADLLGVTRRTLYVCVDNNFSKATWMPVAHLLDL